MRQSKFGLLPLFWFMFAVISIESRYINHAAENDTTDEDLDLEKALSDYYDNLLEVWGVEPKNEQREEENTEEENLKPKREEVPANHLSGLLSKVPNESDNNTKNYYDLTIPIQIGNVTYRFLNESYAAVLDRQRANRESDINEGNTTTRIKSLRLNSIKDSVLGLRGGNSSQNSFPSNLKHTKTLKEIFEKQAKDSSSWSRSSKYAEKSQSFFPSCEIPKNTDESIWSEPYSMNLFFDVYFPVPQQDSTLMIVNAALKLYTVPQTSSSFANDNSTPSEFGFQMNQGNLNIPNYGLVNDEDKRIRISVYWHTRSLRRQRIKKKLLDSQMLPLTGDNSLTFDIRPAVRSWKESGKNFGLQVIVEDENGTLHRPSDYIYPMNCSKLAAMVKPLPLFGFDSAAQYLLDDVAATEDANKSANEISANEEGSLFPYRPVKYPILGLQMRDISISEIRNLVKLKSAQMELASRYGNLSQRNQRLSDSDEKSKDSSSRVTEFENVPLGLPLNRNFSTKLSEDANGNSKPLADQRRDQEKD